MAKFYGMVGYTETAEVEPGLWAEQIIERPYYGDLIRNSSKFSSSDSVNGDISFANEISIVSDPYANQNFCFMRYVTFMGAKWTVTSVEVKYPRLILSIGGVYNGEQATTAE